MRELLNVLYVLTQGTVLHLEHDTVRVEVDGETRLRAPLIRLSGIVVFGRVTVTPFLIQRCAEDGRSVVWLNMGGRFKASLQGPAHGNVLLRRAQHLALSDAHIPWQIARAVVAGKIQNSRQVLMRASRESNRTADREALSTAAQRLAEILVDMEQAPNLDSVRGSEGDAARCYFGVFARMVRVDRESFGFDGRTRRPPRDRMNALISFLYALVRTECSAALEGVGLDPQVGFLHALRPGRPALALDLMEEFRPVFADRLALTLVNRQQLQAGHFEETLGGAFSLTEDGRRIVITAYQRRKEEERRHRLLRERIPMGLVPHVQSRLLARFLRGDLANYPPFLYR